ncbi:unnamed protein product [Arabis nemorensis]|uniref:UBX domain-containing protein n=1 Tax=Arabis nemorensis TaxID=586526 RepID=A0A565AXN0_9BRAS|nr:unnamed protein product [Arabis nemorensis]
MANLDVQKIVTFVRITRTEQAYAVHKLKQREGDLNAPLDAHYRFAATNIANRYVPDSEDSMIDIDDSEEESEEAEDALYEYGQSHLQDPFLAHAISMSLETVEIEKQLREVANTIRESLSGVTEAHNVDHLRQMQSSSRSLDEENESRGVPASSLVTASALDEAFTNSLDLISWLTLYEAAMFAEVPDSRYRSGSLAPRTPSPSAEIQRLIRDKQELEKQLAEKEASLPLEPAIDEGNAVTILIRMPSGNRLTRCFMKSHNLQTLFDFIDISRLVKPNTYRLVKPFPRETFGAQQSCLTLQELGLTNKQEALFLEMI